MFPEKIVYHTKNVKNILQLQTTIAFRMKHI